MPEYSYVDDHGVLISERYSRFDQVVEDLRQGLDSQGEAELLDEEELIEDSLVEVSDKLFGDDVELRAERYLLEEEGRAVYIFEHQAGKLLIGDEPMMACAMPDYVPETVYTGLGDEMDQDAWQPGDT